IHKQQIMTSTSTATSMLRDDQKIVKSLEGNNICADCEQTNPTWCSVSFGILLCLECSGKHRGLGTHISFVRSLDMDSFSAKQIQVLKIGGNKQCNSYLQDQHTQQQPQQQRENTTTDDFTTTACTNPTTKNNSARVKYDNNIAELYKLKLKARVEGKPEPTELP
ncbi:Arf GTPase activating protein, partial [Fragilariopsis cylindrus CCMP1102]